jgi:hypothetical protein
VQIWLSSLLNPPWGFRRLTLSQYGQSCRPRKRYVVSIVGGIGAPGTGSPIGRRFGVCRNNTIQRGQQIEVLLGIAMDKVGQYEGDMASKIPESSLVLEAVRWQCGI